MENEKRNNQGLDLVGYSAAVLTFGFLFIAAKNYFYKTESDVLGASTSASFSLPLWVSLSIAFLIIMGIVVLLTVLLSHATIKKMKR